MLQNMFYKFLWNGNNDKVKRSILTQGYNYGGIKMDNLNLFASSMKITWLRRLLSMSKKINHIVECVCPQIKDIYKFGPDYLKRNKHFDSNTFWIASYSGSNTE